MFMVGYFHTTTWFNENPWVDTTSFTERDQARLHTWEPASTELSMWPELTFQNLMWRSAVPPPEATSPGGGRCVGRALGTLRGPPASTHRPGAATTRWPSLPRRGRGFGAAARSAADPKSVAAVAAALVRCGRRRCAQGAGRDPHPVVVSSGGQHLSVRGPPQPAHLLPVVFQAGTLRALSHVLHVDGAIPGGGDQRDRRRRPRAWVRSSRRARTGSPWPAGCRSTRSMRRESCAPCGGEGSLRWAPGPARLRRDACPGRTHLSRRTSFVASVSHSCTLPEERPTATYLPPPDQETLVTRPSAVRLHSVSTSAVAAFHR